MASIDLTTEGSSGTANGAIFSTNIDQPTGTGFIDSFLRVQNNGDEDGFNTDATVGPINSAEGTDMLAGNFTHDIQLQDIPTVTIDGVEYRVFRLDINEPEGGDNELLSLDELRIYTNPTGQQTDPDNLGTLVYDLDAGPDGESTILMNYDLNEGSGGGDITVLIPDSAFGTAADTDFVYLYSEFGLTAGYGSADGFEEWFVREEESVPPVDPPEEPPEEPPQPGAFVFEKDVDINVDANLALDVDLNAEVDNDVDINVNVDVDVDIEGNYADFNIDVGAIGDNSATELDLVVLVTDELSMITASGYAAVE